MASSDWTLVLKPQKPNSFMLKDFLLDDFSSCSSNGFRSFPRRQCCSTTVRFLLDLDLKVKDSSLTTKRFLPRTTSRKIALSTISTLQRASDAVLRAFKQFPLPSSRKLFFKAFWKKSDIVLDPNSTRRPWKSFREFLDEKEDELPPSSSSSSSEQNRAVSGGICSAIVAVAGRNSVSSCSNSISWTESEFTSSEMMMIPSSFSSGNSESCSENDAVKDVKDSPDDNLIGKRNGVPFGKDSVEETTTAPAGGYREDIVKQWQNEEEKEQLSPVSVLDFPFEDEDHDISSSFDCNIHLFEGKKQKHREKTKRLEKEIMELEPLDLEKRFTNVSIIRQDFTLITKKEHQMEEKALELLKLLKSATKSTENLLLDFFHQQLEEHEPTPTNSSDFDPSQLLKFTQDWIDGDVRETMVMGWESPEERSVYIKDMEVAGKWRSFVEEKEELVAEFEAEVWMSLFDDLVIDLSL